jgi:toxin ParE1/3/4
VRVRWLRGALKNLDDEAAHIAREDLAAAAHMIERITSAVDQLASPPALGRLGRVPGTRELVISSTPYIIPYRIRGDVIEILRVFHGARKWPAKF